MDGSPFAKLPRELRDAVWELALYCPQPIYLWASKIGRRLAKSGAKRHKYTLRLYYDNSIQMPHRAGHLLAKASVCKQIRKEAAPLFYAVNQFQLPRFMVYDSKEGRYAQFYARELSVFGRWLKFIGVRNAQAITRLIVDFGFWYVDGMPTDAVKWWSQVKNKELELLLPGLRLKSLHVQAEVHLEERLFEIPFSWCSFCCQVTPFHYTPQQGKYYFGRPTFDASIAEPGLFRNGIQESYQAKLDEVNEHESHQNCDIADILPELRRQLKQARDGVLSVLNLRAEGVDASA